MRQYMASVSVYCSNGPLSSAQGEWVQRDMILCLTSLKCNSCATNGRVFTNEWSSSSDFDGIRCLG